MEIQQNLKEIKNKLPVGTTLVAVTKTRTLEEIRAAYESGHRIFGENKVQEMAEKQAQLPEDVEWHMIGHLQRNKVKYICGYVALIHGVDSLKLLKEINKRAGECRRIIPCLLQVHIAEEESKFGFSETSLLELIEGSQLPSLEHIRIDGLMGMATFTEDTEQIRREFRHLKRIFDQVKAVMPGIRTLSTGMSADYLIAIEEGSTMVRIGSSIFGPRSR